MPRSACGKASKEKLKEVTKYKMKAKASPDESSGDPTPKVQFTLA